MAGGSHYLTLFSLVRIVLLLRADADESAKFYLAANGVTVHCPGAAVGDSGEVNGFMYTKRNRDQLTEVNAPTACTSGITDMSQLFSNTNFNGDISTWDTSQVTTMNSMFQNARSFDQNLSLWCVDRLKTVPPMFDSGADFEGDSAKQPQWGMPCSRSEGWSRTREVSQVPYVDETDVFTLAPTIDKEFQVFGASKSLKLRMFSPDRYPHRYYGYAKHKEWNGAWPNYVNPFSEFGVCGISNCCKSKDKNECDQCTKGSPSSGYPCYSCGSLSETCTRARENTLIGSELSGPVMVVQSFSELREGFKRTGWKDFYCDISAGSSSVASTQFPFRVFKGDGNLVTDSLCRPMEPLLDYAMADKFTFVNAGCLASYPKCTRRGVFLKSVDAVSEDPRILDWLDSHSIYPLIQPHKQVLSGYTYLSNNGDLPWVSVSVSDNVPDSAMQLSLTSHGEQELIEGCNAIPMQLQWHKQGMAQSLRYGAVDSKAQVTIAQVDGVSRNNLPSGEVNATSKYPELCQTRTHGEAPTKLSQSPKPRTYNDSKGPVAASVGHLAEQSPVMEENIETTKERTTIPGHFSGRGMHTDKGSPPDTSWVNGCSFRTVESPSQVPISALLLSELAFSCTGASALSGFVLQSIAGGTDRFYYEYRCVALETRNPFDRPAEKQSNKTITITRNFDEEIAQNRPQDWYLTYPNKFVSSILDFTSDDFILLQLGKVTCGEYFIKGFHLDLDSRILVDENTIEDKVKYTWECSGTRVREDTCTVQQTMGGMAMNLQEFAQSNRTIDCKDQYLSAFELVRSESGDYYYEYRCCGAYEDLIPAFLGTLQSLNRTEIETYQIDHDPDTLSMEWSSLQLNATALQSQIAEAPFAFPQAHELVTEIGFSQRLFRAWWPFLLAQHHRPTEDNLLAVPKYNILKYMKGSDIQDYLKSIQQSIDGLEQQWDSTKDKSFEFNVLLISLDNVGSLITNMEEAQVKYMKNQVDLQLAALKLQNSAACGRLKTSQDVTDARAEGIAKRQETFEEEIRKWQRQQKLKTVLNMVKGLGNGFRAASKFFGAAVGKGDGALEKFLDGFGLFWNFGFDLGMSAQSVHQAQVSTGKLVDAAKAAKDLYEHYAALYTSLPEALRVPACADIQRNVTSNSTQEIVDSVAYMTSVARALGGFSSLMLEDIEISIEQYYSQFTSGSMVDTAVSTAALNLQKEIIAAVRASFDTKESLVVFLAESIQLSAAMNLQNYTDELNNVVQEYQSKKDSLKDDVRAGTEFMMVNMWHSTTGTLLNIISNQRQLTMQLCVPFVYAYPDTITRGGDALPSLCRAKTLQKYMQRAISLLHMTAPINRTFDEYYVSMKHILGESENDFQNFKEDVDSFRDKVLQRQSNPGDLTLQSSDFLVVDISGYNTSDCYGQLEPIRDYTVCSVGTGQPGDPGPTLPPYPTPAVGMNCTVINRYCAGEDPASREFREQLGIADDESCYCACQTSPEVLVCTKRTAQDFLEVQCNEKGRSLDTGEFPCVGADFSAFRMSNGSEPVIMDVRKFPSIVNLPGMTSFFLQGFEAIVQGGKQESRATIIVELSMPSEQYQWAPALTNEEFSLEAQKGYLTFNAQDMSDFVRSWTYQYREDLPEEFPGQFGRGCACRANEMPRCMCYWSIFGSCPIADVPPPPPSPIGPPPTPTPPPPPANPCTGNIQPERQVPFEDCSGYYLCVYSFLQGNITCPVGIGGIQLLVNFTSPGQECGYPCSIAPGPNCVSCPSTDNFAIRAASSDSAQCSFCACGSSIVGPDTTEVYSSIIAPPTPLAKFGLKVQNLNVTDHEVQSILVTFKFNAQSKSYGSGQPGSPPNHEDEALAGTPDIHPQDDGATMEPAMLTLILCLLFRSLTSYFD